MNSALAVTGLVMGLAGGPHCIAMCGAACAGVARACGGPRPGRAMLAVHAGRIFSYAVGGAVVAGSVSALAGWAPTVAWLRPLWSMVHLAALALGLWLLWAARQPAWLSTLGQHIGRRLAPAPGGVPRARGTARAALVGSLWVAWPCGLLQSALVVAALASGPVSGAAVMAAFGVGSAVSLWAGPALWWRLAGASSGNASQAMAVRLAGLVLASASAWALAQGLGIIDGSPVCT
jgi:sulfite exporter TauE/SafE